MEHTKTYKRLRFLLVHFTDQSVLSLSGDSIYEFDHDGNWKDNWED